MITSLIRPPKKSTFDNHDPQGIKKYSNSDWISPLKCYKKPHKFLDTPSDWCDCLSAPDDTNHLTPLQYF